MTSSPLPFTCLKGLNLYFYFCQFKALIFTDTTRLYAVRPPHARLWGRQERHGHHHLQSPQQGQKTQGANGNPDLCASLSRTQSQPIQPFGQRAQAWGAAATTRAHPLVPHSPGHPPQSAPHHILLPRGEPPPHRLLLQSHLPPVFHHGEPALLDILPLLLA